MTNIFDKFLIFILFCYLALVNTKEDIIENYNELEELLSSKGFLNQNSINNPDRTTSSNDKLKLNDLFHDELNELNELNDNEIKGINEINENNIKKLKDEFPPDSCLPSKEETIKLYQQKFDMIITDPDENQRFIVGKCSPILIVPPFFGSKEIVQINCKGLANNERDTLRKIRVFCGEDICQNEENENEEHPIYLALLSKVFAVLNIADHNKYSTCLGFFWSHHRNKHECTYGDNQHENCRYSKYIKVTPYGLTTKTVDDSNCGIQAVKGPINTGIKSLDDLINSSGTFQEFNTLFKILESAGYRAGFSYAAVPYDFRRFLTTNEPERRMFNYIFKKLYSNVGKKVLILSHSFGCNMAYLNFLAPENKELLPKVKRHIAGGPPFGGSTALLNVFFHGFMNNVYIDVLDKKVKISNVDPMGFNMLYYGIPSLLELRPLPSLETFLEDEKYKEFKEAIEERIELEKRCYNKDCQGDERKSEKFDALFRENFPSLYYDKIECNSNTNKDEYSKIDDRGLFTKKCFINIYNIEKCPLMIAKSLNPTISNFSEYCGNYNPLIYYLGNNTSSKKSYIEEAMKTKADYAYKNQTKVEFLINRFNEKYGSIFDKIDKSFFANFSTITQELAEGLDKYNNESLTLNLEPPDVPTDVVYSSFMPTMTGFIFDENDYIKNLDETYFHSGDGTVSTWSSLLVGLKWIYDEKKAGKKNKIRLVEYCSRLSMSEKFGYSTEKLKERENLYIGLGCDCLKKSNKYAESYTECNHAIFYNDKVFLNYILDVATYQLEDESFEDNKKAAKTYNKNYKFIEECNKEYVNIINSSDK